ncbi:unnamed protein product, partial [Brenthis ino]
MTIATWHDIASFTETLHVNFLEKLSKVAQWCGAAACCDERAIREALRMCAARRDARAHVRHCDNEVSRSRSHHRPHIPAERDGRRCARASEPPPAPARPALISLPAAGKQFACAIPRQLALRPPTTLRRTRIFLDNSANNLFVS